MSIRAATSSTKGSFTLDIDVETLEAAAPANAGTPASAQGGGAVVAMGGQKDRAEFTRLEDRPQHGVILNGIGDDQMKFNTQQGQVAQQDRGISMLDYLGTTVTT